MDETLCRAATLTLCHIKTSKLKIAVITHSDWTPSLGRKEALEPKPELNHIDLKAKIEGPNSAEGNHQSSRITVLSHESSGQFGQANEAHENDNSINEAQAESTLQVTSKPSTLFLADESPQESNSESDRKLSTLALSLRPK